MRTKRFGPTDYETTVIGLGGMPLSLSDRPGRADAIRVIHASLDAGVRLIDTADVYCIDDDDIGHNEALIREALETWSGDASTVLVCTKGGLRRPGGEWTRDGRPEHLKHACERSLTALGVERIAVYQLHAPDPDVPFEDSVGALADLQREGKVQHVGLSNVDLDELRRAERVCPIVSVQNRCNPFDLRSFENGVIDHCEHQGLAFLPWSPVGGSRGKGQVSTDHLLEEVGQRHDASPFEVALSWLLKKSPAMFPIPGASRVESAISSARATELTLDEMDESALDAHLHYPG